MTSDIFAAIRLFLKGCIIGMCDIVPGISGGTIAFITGIYERLMRAIRSYSFSTLYHIYQFLVSPTKAKRRIAVADIAALDIPFLSTVGIGVVLGLYAASFSIAWLLREFPSQTFGFFVGLILISAWSIYHVATVTRVSHYILPMSIGVLCGLSIAFITPATATPTWWYMLLAGFFAISAMFLPGVSGSFILLVLGVYEYMLAMLHSLRFDISSIPLSLVLFGIGAVAGAMTISRVITWCFTTHKNITLLFLVGLVIGALAVPVMHMMDGVTIFTWVALLAGIGGGYALQAMR